MGLMGRPSSGHPVQKPETKPLPSIPSKPDETAKPSLSAEEVEYLSFMGGGGKGGAYLGALLAMTHPAIGIMKYDGSDYYLNTNRIKGVSGTSAGAITAALLASGLSLRQLYTVATDPNLAYFMDPPGKTTRMWSEIGTETKNKDYKFKVYRKPGQWVEPVEIWKVNHGTPPNDTALESRTGSRFDLEWKKKDVGIDLGIIQNFIASKIYENKIQPILKRELGSELYKKINENIWKYIINFLGDYGLFSGTYAREYIAKKTGRKTFENLDVDLRLVGVNLTTGLWRYLSKHTAANLPVADAVRISMSIPFVFKPVVVRENQPIPAGLWVDGGLQNNNPMHAFDTTLDDLNDNMLGLRFVNNRGANIQENHDLMSYSKGVFSALLSRTEYAEIRTPKEAGQSIRLHYGPLSTLDFTPNRSELQLAMIYSIMDTFKYFQKTTQRVPTIHQFEANDLFYRFLTSIHKPERLW